MLVEINLVNSKCSQRSLTGLPKIRWPTVDLPGATGSSVATLCCDQHAAGLVTAGAQRIGNEPFIVVELVGGKAIRVGGVDQSHPALDCGPDRFKCAVATGTTVDRQLQGAQPDRANCDRPDRALPGGKTTSCFDDICHLTAPTVTPDAMKRCAMSNKTTAGSDAMTAVAMTGPHICRSTPTN